MSECEAEIDSVVQAESCTQSSKLLDDTRHSDRHSHMLRWEGSWESLSYAQHLRFRISGLSCLDKPVGGDHLIATL